MLAAFAPGGADGTTGGARPVKKTPQPVAGELLIGFRADVSTAEQKQVLAKIGATEKRKFKQIHGALAKLHADATASALAQLRSDGIISVQGRRIRIIDERRLRARAVT